MTATFEIDTGPTVSPVRQFIPDFFCDEYINADDDELTRRYCFYIIGELRRPKKLETVRRHLAANWQFIRHAMQVCPGHVDEILSEYVERTQTLD